MSEEFALAASIVTMTDPIAPKMDLVLGEDGLSLSEDFEEILQELVICLLRQLGDYRYDRNRGMPWIANPNHRMPPIYGGVMDARSYDRIKAIVQRELFKHPRVKRVMSINVTTDDFTKRRIKIEASVLTFDERLVKLVV